MRSKSPKVQFSAQTQHQNSSYPDSPRICSTDGRATLRAGSPSIFLDVISRGNQWRREMSVVFSGYTQIDLLSLPQKNKL